MKRTRRLLSILISLCMVITMLPAAAFAADDTGQTTAANTEKAIRFDTDGIGKRHHIYYGKRKGAPISWRVLDTKTNTGEDGFFLLTAAPLEEDLEFKAGGSGNTWPESNARRWCEDFAGISGDKVEDAFTPIELGAILETTKSDGDYKSKHGTTCKAMENILNRDKVFFLSMEEAYSDEYGDPRGDKFELTDDWWLRTYDDDKWGLCGDHEGNCVVPRRNDTLQKARPAFNLGKNEIVFVSPADGSETADNVDSNLKTVSSWNGNEWKLTLKDSSRSFSASADKEFVKAGETITISYSGAKTGDNEYVTAIITDKNKEHLYYGRIAQNSAEGKAQITVPEGLEEGRYILRVFSEQGNGNRKTDYVSEFVNLNLSISGGFEYGSSQLLGYNECAYDYIYYGSRNGTPIKWRVLDNETNTGEPGYFLLSEELMGSYGEVYFAEDDTYSWQNSHAKSWCKAFAEDSFTEDEKKYMIAVSKTEGKEYNENGTVGYLGSVLENEKVFFLSIFEARNPEYGLDSNELRAGKLNGQPWKWWLRSRYFLTEMGYIDENGQYTKTTSFAWQIPAARPAFNLDGTDILFLSKAEGGKADTETDPDLVAIPERGNGEWKLTIKESSRNFTAHTLYTATYEKEAGETITIKYSGAKTGSNEYVSAIFADEQGRDLYYGRIAADSSSGIADVAVPETLPAGEYTLKIYSEQYNGEYRTDYASDFVEILITVTGPDKTDPQAKIVSARRISLTEAEVVFQSNEPGTYSYTFVNSGEVYWAAANPRGEGIIPKRSTEQTIVISGLTPRVGGELHLYVEDRSGNQYQGSLRVNIPADVMYDVTLHGGKDTVIAEGKNVTQYVLGVGEALPAAEDMSKSGSVFKGWYAESDFSGTPVTEISDTDAGDKVFYAKWEWDLQEQFNLTPGTTCYFDLSGEGIPGKINGGNSDGAVPVPDKTLHYVPFTYAGTIDAYRLSSDISTTDESALANRYVHSLFVSDYNLTNTVSWRDLKDAGLVFGKSYTSGNIGYTLRIPSGGNRDLSLVGKEAIRPYSNEWDTILDKNEGYI